MGQLHVYCHITKVVETFSGIVVMVLDDCLISLVNDYGIVISECEVQRPLRLLVEERARVVSPPSPQ